MKRLIGILTVIILLTGCTTLAPAPSFTPTKIPTAHPTPMPTATTEPAPTQTPVPTPVPTPEIGSQLHPYKIGETAIITIEDKRDVSMANNYQCKVTLEQVIRGDAAWKIVHKGNMFNNKPDKGAEYLLAKFKVEIISDTVDPVEINEFLFHVYSADGSFYYQDSVAGVNPEFSRIYKGASAEGYVKCIVNKSDIAPEIAYFQKYNWDSSTWSGGVWFATTK